MVRDDYRRIDRCLFVKILPLKDVYFNDTVFKTKEIGFDKPHILSYKNFRTIFRMTFNRPEFQ